MNEPSIAVVIPTRSQFDYTAACLRSLYRTSPWAVPIVVDDASSDWPYAKGVGDDYPGTVLLKHFDGPAGLTRGWNFGIGAALELGTFDYIVATNSDVLFTANWWQSMCMVLDKEDFNLVGPVSNAPGVTNIFDQNVRTWANGMMTVTDNPEYNDALAARLFKAHKGMAKSGRINGFFMMATPATWLATANDGFNVFPERIDTMPSGRRNPTPLMTGQEDWLQSKRKGKQLSPAIVPGSYIFHYRSVSRGPAFAGRGGDAFRKASP